MHPCKFKGVEVVILQRQGIEYPITLVFSLHSFNTLPPRAHQTNKSSITFVYFFANINERSKNNRYITLFKFIGKERTIN